MVKQLLLKVLQFPRGVSALVDRVDGVALKGVENDGEMEAECPEKRLKCRTGNYKIEI